MREYHYYKDGFECGDDASFYKSGQISRYTCFENGTTFNKPYKWYENGILKEVAEYSKDGLQKWVRKFSDDGDIIK